MEQISCNKPTYDLVLSIQKGYQTSCALISVTNIFPVGHKPPPPKKKLLPRLAPFAGGYEICDTNFTST